ncbi:hypothetical protein PVAP13_1NG073200 [Panicum virgatum]|uniref:Ubiquitin-like protease family profile domain-containing protein n=1 Tax=Panicum virgatum TaxID=38727 RepID=A0A8T0WLJ7_PANVG|nr:hypothetical protein PVAP13_1NG073200 [Panicum virgatum]
MCLSIFLFFHVQQYERLKELKRKLKLSVTLENNKSKPDHKPKDAFTRFSVTAFSSILDSLNPRQREVIESYGFGSLLNFDKCFVPNKFAKWVANVVDYKSGDIVVDGKIISLTKESVHYVLGIPLGGDPFPSDTVCGKEFVLNKFQKSSIPPVTFFSNKLVKEGGTLSDEDLFVCFIIVALSSFLCANSSSTPSPKYFGIFGDIKRVKEFDWCGYVLDWLLDGVKLFKKSKPSRVKDNRTLAGCLYYLAVMYLDFVDFGPRRLPNTLPRICVWKGNMLKTYSDLDLKPNGSYGFRPVLDFSDTCYSKNLHLHDTSSQHVALNVEFRDKLDSVSRNKLPIVLKNDICKAIENHCFNSGLRLDLDVTALASLPEHLVVMFSKLLRHASNIDHRSKELVLDVMKIIGDADGSYDRNVAHDISTNVTPSAADNKDSPAGHQNIDHPVPGDTPAFDHSAGNSFGYSHDFGAQATPLRKIQGHIIIITHTMTWFHLALTTIPQWKPFGDITNVDAIAAEHTPKSPPSSRSRDNPTDVIMLQDDVEFVPDSYSPEPCPVNRRSIVQKDSPDIEVLGQTSFSQSALQMARQSDLIYNKRFRMSDAPRSSLSMLPTYHQRDSSTGGKMPVHGPRRVVKPGFLFNGDFEIAKPKITVSKSEMKNYQAICNLATSEYSNEDVVSIGKVCCTFWSLGESLKPGGTVNPFVISAFCYGLYIKPNAPPDVSKSHYFFANTGENLLKDIDEANQEVLARSFKRSSRSRPLNYCNNLFFPIFFNEHWFVFVVDIKDRKFVFLDSLYQKDHEFHEIVRDRLITSFQVHWDNYVQF